MIEMKVSGLTIDPFTDMPIIILKDLTGKRAIPIWIGLIEASAIATELEKVRLARPMTHDLMCDAIGKLGGRVVRVEVNELRNNTFYARVCVDTGEGIVELDSRPSDAIALALRSGSQILVSPEVIDRVECIDLERETAQARDKVRRGRKTINGGPKPVDGLPLGEPRAGKRAAGPRGVDDGAADSADVYRALLESLSDEDFGKWKM